LSKSLPTKELWSHLEKSDDRRVVCLTSVARFGSPLVEKDFGGNGGNLGGNGASMIFNGTRWERYHQTKLANSLKVEAKEDCKVKSLLAHPSVAATAL